MGMLFSRRSNVSRSCMRQKSVSHRLTADNSCASYACTRILAAGGALIFEFGALKGVGLMLLPGNCSSLFSSENGKHAVA